MIASPVLRACLLNFGNQATMITNRGAIYAVAPKARNRVKTGCISYILWTVDGVGGGPGE